MGKAFSVATEKTTNMVGGSAPQYNFNLDGVSLVANSANASSNSSNSGAAGAGILGSGGLGGSGSTGKGGGQSAGNSGLQFNLSDQGSIAQAFGFASEALQFASDQNATFSKATSEGLTAARATVASESEKTSKTLIYAGAAVLVMFFLAPVLARGK